MTELGRRWRDDAEYPAVCKEIIQSIFPQDLIDAVPDPTNDYEAAVRWFKNAGGLGQAAAVRLSNTYKLLSMGDPSAGEENKKRNESNSRPAKKMRSQRAASDEKANVRPAVDQTTEHHFDPSVQVPHTPAKQLKTPNVHIDIQIHIAADAPASQVDQIFASMAKHLYGREEK